MTDKILVIVFILSAFVCVYAILQYVQKQSQKYFVAASVAGLVCALSFVWVYYDLG